MGYHLRRVASRAFFEAFDQAFGGVRYAVDTEGLVEDGTHLVVFVEGRAYGFPFGFARLDPAAVDGVAVAEHFIRRAFVFAVGEGRAGAEEAFDGQVVMAFVGTDVEDVADAAVGRGHDLQAAEEDFGLLTVVFADVEVEPVAGLGVGQRRERGFLFGELAGCGFFGAFFVACVEGGIFFAESGGVDCRGGEAEGQEGETAHGVLQSEKRLYFMGSAGWGASKYGIIHVNPVNGTSENMNAHTLDLKGLRCPLPILKTKKALAQMQAGEVLTVLATDGGAPGDFEAFCRQTGHVLLESREEDGVFTLVVKHK